MYVLLVQKIVGDPKVNKPEVFSVSPDKIYQFLTEHMSPEAVFNITEIREF